jgi:hypothetical protein
LRYAFHGHLSSAFCYSSSAGRILTHIILCLPLKPDNCIENDRCLTATSVDTLPFAVSASNILASAAGYNSSATICGNRVDGTAKAVWYELIGDGSCVSASIAGEGFDAILALYEGDNCGSLSCLANSNSGSGGPGLLSWRTETGTAYKILVTGAYGDQAGNYVLGITVREEGLHVMRFPWFIFLSSSHVAFLYIIEHG